MTLGGERLRGLSAWFALARVLAVPLAVLQVLATDDFPRGYRTWAWVACGVLAAGALTLFVLTRRPMRAAPERIAEAALVFDTAIVFAFIFLYSFKSGQPTWALFYIPVIEAALRFGLVGGLAVPLVTAPLLFAAEAWRAREFEPSEIRLETVGVRLALGVVIGAVVGKLVSELVSVTSRAETRADEAERLRDELGRRANVLEAASQCARALGSSLDLDAAFDAFIAELRIIVPFDRVAIVLAENGVAQAMAVAGKGADRVLPAGSRWSASDALVGEILRSGTTAYREDMLDQRYVEERELVALGLRARLAVPLLRGGQPIGMLSLLRAEPRSFSPAEIELLELLGRLVAGTVQNIRAYEAERRTADELRRLSAMRADFVSLVSHELRTPMAAVIGSAATLRQRWRELTPEQRDSFLALIADETNRLATLVGEVLDTSRIEAGTFSYTFDDVDVGEAVREAAAAADIAQDEVRVRVETHDPLPRIRGDRDRIRQVLVNLLENAIKYSPPDGLVDLRAYADNGRLRVEVRDSGPGIASEDQKLIFEKFGRVTRDGAGRPGTGLGLFIARSIAEAHGGSLDVSSVPERGATFTLELPVD